MTFIPEPLAARYSLFNRRAAGPVAYSVRQDIATVVGSGTVTTSGTELRLQTTALASDEAKVISSERGELRGGDDWIEYGVTARVPVAPTGNQEAFWGAFTDDYGIGFGQDGTDYFIFTRRSAVTTKIYQSNWNVNTLSGLDSSKAAEYVIRIPHYSYGGAEFLIREFGTDGVISETLVHRFVGVTGAIDSLANLPLSGAVDNGATATAFNLYLGDRWCAFQGPGRNRNQRLYGQFFINRSITTTETAFISLRKKSGALNQAVNCRLYDLEIVSDQPTLSYIYTGSGLTGASFGDYPNTSEAVTERDISATAFTAGDFLYACIGAANVFNKWEFTPDILPLRGTDPITLTSRTTSGSSTTSTHFGLRILEEW